MSQTDDALDKTVSGSSTAPSAAALRRRERARTVAQVRKQRAATLSVSERANEKGSQRSVTKTTDSGSASFEAGSVRHASSLSATVNGPLGTETNSAQSFYTRIHRQSTATAPIGLRAGNTTNRFVNVMPPTEIDANQAEDFNLQALFYIRYQKKIPLPGQSEYEWKLHQTNLFIPAGGEACLGIRKMKEKGMPAKEMRELPLRRLELVDRGYIPEKEAVRFEVEDENGEPIDEYRFGHLLLLLSFDLQGTYFRLDLCCNSTEERDMWFQWFTDFIVNCELRIIRGDLPEDDVQGKKDAGKTEKRLGEAETVAEADDAAVIERPTQGVQMFIVRFLSAASAQQESAAETDPKAVPDKGKVLQITGQNEEKRKLVCPETGLLQVKTRVGLTKISVDLARSSIQVESPWGQTFSIKQPDGKPMLHFKAASMEVRQKMVDWLIAMKGKPQSDAETYGKKDGKDDDELSDNKSMDRSPSNIRRTGDQVGDASDRASSTSGTSEDLRDYETLDERNARARALSKAPGITIAEAEEEEMDDDERKMMAYPLDTATGEEGDLSFGSDPIGSSVRGEWCRVQYQRVNQRPSAKSAFAKRFVTINPQTKKLFIFDIGTSTTPAVELALSDIRCFTTVSFRFGLMAISLHCEIPIVVHIIPPSQRSKQSWIDQLSRKFKVKWTKDETCEEIEKKSHPSATCYLCGKNEATTAVCRATMLQHKPYLDALALKKPEEIEHIFDSLPPKAVVPPSLAEAISRTELLLEQAEEHSRRARAAASG